MFLVLYHQPALVGGYWDFPVLLTDDFRRAICLAKDFAPAGWRDPGWSHQEKAFVFRLVRERQYPAGPEQIFARYLKKFRGKMRWEETWSDPRWEKAYQRSVQTAARAK